MSSTSEGGAYLLKTSDVLVIAAVVYFLFVVLKKVRTGEQPRPKQARD